MYRIMLFVAGLLTVATASALDVQFSGCDIGEVYAFSSAACKIRVANHSDREVHVEFLPAKGDTIEPGELTIAPGHSAQAVAGISIANSLGSLTRYIEAKLPDGERALVTVTGFVMSTLANPNVSIDFGRIEAFRNQFPKKVVEIESDDAPEFRAIRVLDRPAQLDVRISPSGTSLAAAIRHDADWGILDGHIKLAVASPYQSEVWIPVSGSIVGEIAPPANPYWFDGAEASSGGSVLIPLFHRGGLPFRVGRVTLELAKGRAAAVPCDPVIPGCNAVRVNFDQTEPRGITRGVLRVELPDLNRTLAVRIWGILGAVHRSDSSASGGDANEAVVEAPWNPSIIESLGAPVYAMPTSPAESDEIGGTASEAGPPPGSGPLLQWSATDELGAYGYQVFRARSKTGPYARINKHAIRVHSTVNAGQPYYWRDTTALKGETYWYYVGVVYKDGRKEQLTPRQEVVAH